MAELKKSLGLAGLTFYGTGLILGAGIYSIIGKAAGIAGDALWMTFLLAGAIALLTGLSFAELSTMYPKAGAEYTYFRKAFPKHEWVSRFAGSVLIVGGMGTAATVATAFAGYFKGFYDAPPMLVAACLLAVATAVSIVGIAQSSWVNIIMTLIEAAGLIFVVWLGFTRGTAPGPAAFTPGPGIFMSAGLVFFAYLGFEQIANVAEEAKDPARDLPRALFLSLGISTLLYILVSLAAVALLSPEKLAESQQPLADAVAAKDRRFAPVLGGIALFATANTCLISIIGTSRMVLGMARQKDMPKFLAVVSGKGQTPWAASLLCMVGAALILPLRDTAAIGGLASLGALLAFAGVNVALIRLRKTEPNQERPFRVPLDVRGVPVLPVIGCVGAVVLAFVLPPIAHLIMAVLLVVLIVVEIIRKRRA